MGGKRRAAGAIAAVVIALAAAGSRATAAPPSNPPGRTPTPTPTSAPTPTPIQTPLPPTPAPTARPVPTPTPAPSPPPPPTPAPVPPPCDTRVPQATGPGGYLQAAGLAGGATEPAHSGAIVLTGVSPASMLPPVVGTAPLTEVTLAKAADPSSQTLVRAVAAAMHFDCAWVEMGPARDYLYATYAFRDAQFATYTPAGAQQTTELLTLTYDTVRWEYQLRDGSPVATGSGTLGSTPNPRALQARAVPQGPAPLGLFVVVLVAAGAGGFVWHRRRLRAGSRRP